MFNCSSKKYIEFFTAKNMRELITTWDKLWLHRNSRKTFLIILEPAQVVTDWVFTAASVWYTAWSGGIYSDTDFTKVTCDGEALTRVTDIGGLSVSGTCFLDRTLKRLYVHCASDSNPSFSLMLVFFRQYFGVGTSGTGTELCEFTPEGSPYPVQFKRCILSLPGITQKLADTLFSGATNTLGILRLANGRNKDYGGNGPMDESIHNYIYYGKACECRAGGEDLPYSEYKMFFSGAVKNLPSLSRTVEMTIDDSISLALEYKLPDTFYSKDDYPHLDPNYDGKPIAWGFGYCRNARPVQIDTTIWKFKIAAHKIKALLAVRENGIDITGNIRPGTIDLENATFELQYYAAGKVITVDFQGYVDGSGECPERYGSIASVLLKKALPDSKIDSASLSAVSAARPYACCLYIDSQTKVVDLLNKLNESVLAWHGTSRDGKIFAQPWEMPSAVDVQYRYVYGQTAKNVVPGMDYGNIYKTVRIAYAQNLCVQSDTATKDTDQRQDWSHDYLYLPGHNNITAALYNCSDTLTVYTLLSNKADAEEVQAERIGLHMLPWFSVSFEAPIQPYRQSMGNVFALDECRDIPSGMYFVTTALSENKQGGIVKITGLSPAAGLIG